MGGEGRKGEEERREGAREEGREEGRMIILFDLIAFVDDR